MPANGLVKQQEGAAGHPPTGGPLCQVLYSHTVDIAAVNNTAFAQEANFMAELMVIGGCISIRGNLMSLEKYHRNSAQTTTKTCHLGKPVAT